MDIAGGSSIRRACLVLWGLSLAPVSGDLFYWLMQANAMYRWSTMVRWWPVRVRSRLILRTRRPTCSRLLRVQRRRRAVDETGGGRVRQGQDPLQRFVSRL